MRKHLARIAILAVCSLGLVGLAPAVAPAATNCATDASAISRYVDSGYQVMGYTAAIFNCTDVSAVRWKWNNGPGSMSGFYDYTQAAWHQGYLNGTQSDVTLNNPGGGYNYVWVAQTCWYGGSHLVMSSFLYQIKSSLSPFAWGPLHTKSQTSPVNITC